MRSNHRRAKKFFLMFVNDSVFQIQMMTMRAVTQTVDQRK